MFCLAFVTVLAAIFAQSAFSDEADPPQPIELDSTRLNGAAVTITSNGPDGAFSFPVLTLNMDKSVGGCEAVIDIYRKPLRELVSNVQINVTKPMTWNTDGSNLTITWAVELKSEFYQHSLTQTMTLTPDINGKIWKGQYRDVVVTNGVTSPVHHETPLTGVVKLPANNGKTAEIPANPEEQIDFNSEVEMLIMELLKQAAGDAAKAQQLAEALRDERGDDAVSVAVEHYLFGLAMDDLTYGLLRPTTIPVGFVVGWEVINWAWLNVFGRPAENPSFTIGGVNWGAGLLNPGDRGDHLVEITLWGTAGAYGYRPQVTNQGVKRAK